MFVHQSVRVLSVRYVILLVLTPIATPVGKLSPLCIVHYITAVTGLITLVGVRPTARDRSTDMPTIHRHKRPVAVA